MYLYFLVVSCDFGVFSALQIMKLMLIPCFRVLPLEAFHAATLLSLRFLVVAAFLSPMKPQPQRFMGTRYPAEVFIPPVVLSAWAIDGGRRP